MPVPLTPKKGVFGLSLAVWRLCLRGIMDFYAFLQNRTRCGAVVKPFLRSGSLDDVLALGENGQPVYACAQQLRKPCVFAGSSRPPTVWRSPSRTKTAPASTGMRPSPARSPPGWRRATPSARRRCATGTLPDDLPQPDGTGPGDRSPAIACSARCWPKRCTCPTPTTFTWWTIGRC